MTDVPGTSPERPIIWSPGRPATGSRRRPVDVPIQNFCIFVFPVKSSNRCVKQELLHLKSTFLLNYQFFCWSPKSPLKVPDVGTCRGPSGDVSGTLRAGWVASFEPLFLRNLRIKIAKVFLNKSAVIPKKSKMMEKYKLKSSNLTAHIRGSQFKLEFLLVPHKLYSCHKWNNFSKGFIYFS